jgi:hypothetical protein
MCQRATGSISIAFVNVQLDSVRWQCEPDWFDSSPIARRPFCANCGTSLGFAYKEGSEKMDLTVAAFDDPSPFTPKHHFGSENISPHLAQHRGPAGISQRAAPAAGRPVGRSDWQAARLTPLSI